MITHSGTATGRRWLAVGALLAVTVIAGPVHAACNPNSYKANPSNATIVQEYNAGSSYQPILVTLGVSKSLADGVVITWSQLQGAPVTLNTANPAAPTFLTPNVPAAGSVLRFQLRATCPGGSTAVDNTGTITIVNVNRPPVAYASAAPSLAYEGDTVTLNSTAPAGTPLSNDPDGDALAYLWTRTAGPAVTLTNATTPSASFTAPTTGGAYSLTFQLRVSDPGGLLSTASVVVNVTPNLPPVARLVCPEYVDEGSPVVLDGSTSTQGSGGTLVHAWTQLQGSPDIVVGDETGNTVEFDAPSLTASFDGLLEFQLQVENSDGLDLATCMVQIVDVTAPVITVPADITVEATSGAGEMVTYSVLARDAAEDNAPYELLTCEPPSGSLFRLAAAPTQGNATTVVCAASDLAGNTADADFDITVQDTTAPVITVPGSFAVEATGPTGAVANYTATKLDAVDGAGNADCVPASGNTFAITTTLVTCTATDARTNAAATKTFNLTVHDTTAPVVTAPADVTAEATGSQTTVSYGTATAADAVGVVSITNNAPTTFPVGTTTILWTAKDAANNAGTATSTVTVQDTTAPVVTAPADVTAEATGPQTTVSYGTATATDAVGVVSITNNAPATFPVGLTTITWTATDAAGNAGTATSAVTVQDTTAPVVTAPADVIAEATGPQTAVAYGNATATDAVGVVSNTNNAPATFPVGLTTITWTATDVAGNAGTATSTVTVQDTTAPVVTAPADVTAEATGPQTTVSYGTAAATDAVGVVSITSNAPATFPVGLTTITWTATDAAGNAGTATSTVTVQDTTAPVVSAPANVIAEATGPQTTVAYGDATATDAVGVVSNTNNAPATFPVGMTTITWTARDAAGNQGIATSTVTVVDTTAPALTTPANFVREATSAAGAAVGFTTSAVDLVSGTVAVTCSPVSGSTFALGSTTVACSAEDAIGNTASASFTVTVRDTTAPTIGPHLDVDATATGNSSAVVTYVLPTVSDLVDPNVTVSCTDASGSTFNVGSTTVNCSATDAAGNTANSTFKIIVGYGFNGFFRPIDNLPIINVVKAGSAIPVKFSLGGNQGLNIFAANYPASVSTACSAAQTDAVEETVTAGSSSLQYDAGADQYIYVWKTDKSWTGCRQLQVKLRDGSSRWATFSFTR